MNHIFVTEFINTALLYGIEVGFYTTKGDWQKIMPESVLNRNPYTASNPLWIPRYDGISSLDFFRFAFFIIFVDIEMEM